MTQPPYTQQSDPQPSPPPKRRGRLLRGFCTLLLLLVIAGIAIRLTVRDSMAAVAPIFYALPPLVLAFLSMLAGLGFARRHAHGRGIACALLTIALLGWGIMQHLSLRNPIGAADGVSVCAWNVSHGHAGWHGISAVLAEDNADIVGLVEAAMDETAKQTLRAAMPEHTLLAGEYGLAFLVRGECGQPKVLPLSDGSQCMRLDVICRELPLTVLLVDIDGNPLSDRSHAIENLRGIADGITDRPVIVLGDFNTPHDSAHFDAWMRGYHNASDSPGCGWQASWPTVAPVLQIDHIWLSSDLDAQRCTFGWSFKSDHRRVEAIVARNQGPGASTP